MPRPTANALRGREFRGMGAIYLSFPYCETAVSEIRRYPQAKWVKTLRCWILPKNRSAAMLIVKLFPDAETNEAFRQLLPSPTKQEASDQRSKDGHQGRKGEGIMSNEPTTNRCYDCGQIIIDYQSALREEVDPSMDTAIYYCANCAARVEKATQSAPRKNRR